MISGVPSMPMFTPSLTPNQSVSNQLLQVGFPTTALQPGVSSESALSTPAETPVLLATPPLISMGMGNVMHPSMLLLPPPSPNSLGIRSTPPEQSQVQDYGLSMPVVLPQVIMQQPPQAQQLQSVPVQQK